jgi:hypothetical protein
MANASPRKLDRLIGDMNKKLVFERLQESARISTYFLR